MKFELDETEKTVLKVVGIAGGALLIYWYLKSNGYWDQWFGGAAAVPSPGPQPVSPDSSSVSSPYDQAAMILASAAPSSTQTVDQWAQMWQSGTAFPGAPIGFGVPGSITSSVMNGLIAASGSQAITAQQFVALILQQQQAGLSGVPTSAPNAGGVQSPWVN